MPNFKGRAEHSIHTETIYGMAIGLVRVCEHEYILRKNKVIRPVYPTTWWGINVRRAWTVVGISGHLPRLCGQLHGH